jgi:hypothetical protein
VIALAAPATEGREASPIGLVLILVLLVATVFLVRSMGKRLRRLPPTFEEPAEKAAPAADPAEPGEPGR